MQQGRTLLPFPFYSLKKLFVYSKLHIFCARLSYFRVVFCACSGNFIMSRSCVWVRIFKTSSAWKEHQLFAGLFSLLLQRRTHISLLDSRVHWGALLPGVNKSVHAVQWFLLVVLASTMAASDCCFYFYWLLYFPSPSFCFCCFCRSYNPGETRWTSPINSRTAVWRPS